MKHVLRFLFNVFDGNDKETANIFRAQGEMDKAKIIKYLDAVQRYAGMLIKEVESHEEFVWE